MTDAIKIGVNADYDPACQKEYEAQAGEDFMHTKGSEITGEAAAWVVISTLSVQALPAIIDFIKFLIGRRQVKSIQLGDLKIENPTAEDVARLEKRARQKAAK
jgi:hypothetical protein